MLFWFLGVGPWEGIEEGGHSVLFRVSLGELLRFCSLVMRRGGPICSKNSRDWRGGLP
jgi:hypothetical protein